MNRIKVNKNKDYTTISNIFLKDNNLSLKAKGFLAVIMSLDDNYKQSEEDSSFRSFIKSDKCKIIQSSSLPIGTKLLSIANECPITLEKINHPIIARDCQVYEYLAFKKHILLKGYISPVLNIKIEPYIYHILENRFEKLIKLI